MDQDDPRRRRILRVAAVTVTGSTAAVAGCTDQEDAEDEPEAEEGTGNGQEQDGEEPEEVEDDDGLGEAEGAEQNGEGGEQILLAADEDEVWIGEEPSEIEGEENPTLELVAGWQYEIGYVNRGGDSHNLALWADDEERDATDVNEEEEQWLTVEASDDLTSYRCEVHPETMEGDIEVDE
ncbi:MULTISPECIES: hypothetical protein [Natrialbaceae]|uniref:hypothetical protein n=1 Tax=Natrialbaceae TaxID=1644061 RepID=UPI00207C8128|nr:hypothetical protein [Natronococcus sp. CG52]